MEEERKENSLRQVEHIVVIYGSNIHGGNRKTFMTYHRL
jgi:hypothetical protein